MGANMLLTFDDLKDVVVFQVKIGVGHAVFQVTSLWGNLSLSLVY